LAASLESRFGEKTEIRPGSTGQFDVITDGRKIFSKAEAGRFPLPDEVEAIFTRLDKSS
jgi:selT/selW/selH-like putative selenoprotein